MKQKRFVGITTIMMVFAVVITMLCPVHSRALSSIDTTKKGTLNIRFEPGVSNFFLYRVATMNESGIFVMEPEFAKYYVGSTTKVVNDLDASGYMALTNELKSLIHKYPIDITATTQTDESGNGAFEDLQTGMYLLLKPRMSVNGVGYLEAAQLVTLPSRIPDEDGNLGDWVYDPTVNVKFLPEEYLNTDIEVEKQWDFSDASDLSEEEKEDLKTEIIVELRVDPGDGTYPWPIYEDGTDTSYGQIVLNKDNNWKQVFEQINLPDGTWEFNEVSIINNFEQLPTVQDGNVTIITNKYIPPSEENTTEDSETPPPTTSTSTTPPPKTTTTTKTKLPQTGQLWWPVPILATFGLVFFGIGALKNKSYSKKNNKNS